MRETPRSYSEILLDGFDKNDLYGLLVAATMIFISVKLVTFTMDTENVTLVQAWGVMLVVTIVGFLIWRFTRILLSDFTP